MGIGARSSDRTNFFFLDRPQQLGLQIDRQLADFVEENRSALGGGQQTVLRPHRAGEGAAHIAEQFALDQGRHQRAAVDRDEGLVFERAG